MNAKPATLLSSFLIVLVLFSNATAIVPSARVLSSAPSRNEATPLKITQALRSEEQSSFGSAGYTPVAELLAPDNLVPRAVAAKDNYTYLLVRERVLFTYDVSDLIGISRFTSLESPIDRLDLNNGSGLLRNGDLLYAFGDKGIEVIDISTPASPSVINSVNDMRIYNLIQYESYLVAGGVEQVGVYAIDDPAAPVMLNQYELPSSTRVFSAAVHGGVLYTGEFRFGVPNSDGLRLYSFSNPAVDFAPFDFISRPNLAYHLYVVNGQLVECTSRDVGLWDVTAPTAPAFLDSASGGGRVCVLNGNDVVINGAVFSPAGSMLAPVATFNAEFGQVDGFPYGSAVSERFVFLAQSPRVLVLSKPDAPDLISSYSDSPPRIDGRIDFGEWEIGNKSTFGHGFVTVLNDRTRLYILVDVLSDTVRNDGATPRDYFWLTFDVDKDGVISESEDLNYSRAPGSVNMRYQYYLGPSSWTGLQSNTRSSKAEGFGCFFADGTLVFKPRHTLTCSSHRVWEFGIDLAEIGAEPGGKVRLGLRVSSPEPSFTEDVPANFASDFSELLEIRLAPQPDLFPLPNPSASVTLETDAIEVTQAIQDRSNSLPLVQDKDTVARVYADVNGVTASQPTVVYLYGSRNGSDLPGSPLSQFHIAPSSIDREELNDTANFLLPNTWTQGTVEFKAGVLDLFGNEISSTPFSLTFTPKEVPTYWVVPVNSGSATSPNIVNNDTIAGQESYLEAVYPLADVDFVRKSWEALGPNISVANTIEELNEYHSMVVLAWLISVLFTGEAPYDLPDQIYGFNTSGGGISDPVWAGGNGYVARGFWGSSREGTMAHEINHNLDRDPSGTWGRHVSDPATTVDGSGNVVPVNNPAWGCGAAGPDSAWPFVNDDDIREVGFDTRLPWADGAGNRDTVIPDDYPDFMSYCQSDDLAVNPAGQLPTKWISPYRWQNLFNYFDTTANAKMLARSAEIQTVYYISGQVHRDGTGSLNPIFVQPGVPSDIAPGDYSIEVQNGLGQVLSSTPFFVTFVNVEGERVDTVSFSYQIPIEKDVSKIVLKSGNDVLDEIVVSDNPPSVKVLSPTSADRWDGIQTVRWQASDPDGDDLRFTLLYSPDDGRSWLPLGAAIEGDRHELDTSLLPGSDTAKLRVIATDGFNTAEADSDTFQLVDKGPSAVINAPVDGAVLRLGEPITFLGEATDAEDVSIPDGALVWLDNGEAFGIGREVSAVLPAGFHTITLISTDSDDNQSQATIQIFVSENSLYLPLVLGGN